MPCVCAKAITSCVPKLASFHSTLSDRLQYPWVQRPTRPCIGRSERCRRSPCPGSRRVCTCVRVCVCAGVFWGPMVHVRATINPCTRGYAGVDGICARAVALGDLALCASLCMDCLGFGTCKREMHREWHKHTDTHTDSGTRQPLCHTRGKQQVLVMDSCIRRSVEYSRNAHAHPRTHALRSL